MNATLGSAAREMGSEEIVRIFDYARMGSVVDADGYRRGIAGRTALTREWNVFLAEYPLVLTPFLLRPAYPWNYDAQGFDQARDLLGRALYSTGVNYLALPAGNAPMGLVEGAPSGVQIIAFGARPNSGRLRLSKRLWGCRRMNSGHENKANK